MSPMSWEIVAGEEGSVTGFTETTGTAKVTTPNTPALRSFFKMKSRFTSMTGLSLDGNMIARLDGKKLTCQHGTWELPVNRKYLNNTDQTMLYWNRDEGPSISPGTTYSCTIAP